MAGQGKDEWIRRAQEKTSERNHTLLKISEESHTGTITGKSLITFSCGACGTTSHDRSLRSYLQLKSKTGGCI